MWGGGSVKEEAEKVVNITATGQKIHLTQSFDCSLTNCVYIVTCNKCKDQYVGSVHKQTICSRGGTGHFRGNLECHFKKCGANNYRIQVRHNGFSVLSSL